MVWLLFVFGIVFAGLWWFASLGFASLRPAGLEFLGFGTSRWVSWLVLFGCFGFSFVWFGVNLFGLGLGCIVDL